MNKRDARKLVWSQLKTVARPDSRFHLDFNEFIPDFEGSERAIKRLLELDIYQQAEALIITPDNCLEPLRAQAVRDGKCQIIPTYGIRRGFVELCPDDVLNGAEHFAVLLDVLEKVGHHISLVQIRERYRIKLMVTGASVVNVAGVRFGKGHGFFDLEWAMMYQLGVVNAATMVIAFVHDCQVVDIDLQPSQYDTICDIVVTPTRVIHVADAQKPITGVLWDKLEPSMLENIPPLQELQQLSRTLRKDILDEN